MSLLGWRCHRGDEVERGGESLFMVTIHWQREKSDLQDACFL